ncbi:glutamate racemase [Pistricoccus aurantiacus]|uniref:Glutamate racemase n=1 Tax=Pistricoccus aurantiacus TaxID=1883414 RepID=A0A5B8SS19_9GAMM|nr:glutamate racemase [Pistricoccus aurantiacus]QEA39446.1 glutamate racemase [Pistricoccus aurantiacus]
MKAQVSGRCAGPILVFDSGLGGLSVVAELRRYLPESGLAYVCDNAMLPYGTKPDAWLIRRIVQVCTAAVRESRAVALVVACNTASTLALEALRQCLAIPVVGTVPAIKPACRISKSGHIALLATSATVNRPYTRRLIRDFAGHCQVRCLAADPLVEQAEFALTDRPVDLARVASCIEPLWEDPALDTVVLGCTHFPLLTDRLDDMAPRPVAWVDSGAAIARRVEAVVEACAPRSAKEPAWTTRLDPTIEIALCRYGFAAATRLTLSSHACTYPS